MRSLLSLSPSCGEGNSSREVKKPVAEPRFGPRHPGSRAKTLSPPWGWWPAYTQTSVPSRTTEMEIILSLHAVIASTTASKIIMCRSQLVQTTVPMCHCGCFSKHGAPRDQRRHTMILDGTAKTKDDTEWDHSSLSRGSVGRGNLRLVLLWPQRLPDMSGFPSADSAMSLQQAPTSLEITNTT